MNRIFCAILMLFFGFFCHTAYGKDAKDSTVRVLSNVYEAYKTGKLPEKVYLDSVWTIMRLSLSENIHFTNKELLGLLHPYKNVAWNSKDNLKYKRQYYGILSNQAQMESRDGEMLYYGEKIDNLERMANNRPSLTGLTIIADFYETQHSPEKVKALYKKEKGYLKNIPAIADSGSMNENETVQATFVLQKIASALYELKDTMEGDEAKAIMDKIAAIARDRYKADNNVTANVIFSQTLVFCDRSAAIGSAALQQEGFRKMEALLADNNTPDYLKYYIHTVLVDSKIGYYLKYKNTDSASRYLEIYEELIRDEGIPYNKYTLRKYRAQNLYNQGRYKESADMFDSAIGILDSSRTILVKSVDDMLYAQAKADEQQLLLEDAEAKNKKTEKQLFITGAIIAVLFVGGLLTVQYIRRRQKIKLMEFKLNMARNIHDETNPALLYAKALAKSSRYANGNDGSKNELELHIGHTMEIIRSLSHDLKSDKQHTLTDLVINTEGWLEKLNASNEFSYGVHKDIDEKRFVSYYQFSQVNAILNECISNTIKHATFNKIDIVFRKRENKLTVIYGDNGKGWPPEQSGTGIGIKNMEERVRQLNGDWVLQNDYPNSYQISFTIALR